MTYHTLSGRGLYEFTYDDQEDVLTTSFPGGLEKVKRWEPYVRGLILHPHRDVPDIELGVEDATREIHDLWDSGDPPEKVPYFKQYALRLRHASGYPVWSYEDSMSMTACHSSRIGLTLFNVLCHGMRALQEAGFARYKTVPKKTPGESVEIAECVHCGCTTLNPQGDLCECGNELYPSTKRVPAGTRIRGRLVSDDD